jgi:hypothetical protein
VVEEVHVTTTTEGDRIDRLYRAGTTPRLVQVPPLTFLCLDGHGDPNTSPQYAAAVQALYAVSYAARFAVTKAGGPPFRVSPLEGLWWADDLEAFPGGDKAEWDWTMMIRQPGAVTRDLVTGLVDDVADRKSMPAVREVRLVSFEEGSAAQVLHVGPYASEAPSIVRLHEFIHDQGFSFDGRRHKHHEIYLGDPRRSAPERLRTILRQPYAAP